MRRSVYLSVVFAPVLLGAPLLLFQRGERLWWRLLLDALVRAGPCFMKFGQWAAARPDLFNPRLCAELSRLHDGCPAHSFAATRREIEAAYGAPLDTLFASIDATPIASGTVAQVHRARMHDGLEVAVKVLHPRVAERIEVDLRLLHALASLVQRLPRMQYLALRESVEQFAYNMSAQLDLRYEARNLRRFARNFVRDRHVGFAQPLAPSMCHRTVLIESFEHGTPLKHFLRAPHDAVRATDADDVPTRAQRRAIAHFGVNAFLRMMLIHNFVHADMHPGNILVERHGDAADDVRIVFLDCGLVSQLSDADNDNFVALFMALCDGDAEAGAEMMIDRSRSVDERMRLPASEAERAALPPDELAAKLAWRRAFVRDVSSTLGKLRDQQLSDIRVGSVMQDVFAAARNYGVQIEPHFATLVIGTAVIEGVGRQLDPDLSLIDAAEPVLLRRHALQTRERVRNWLRDDCALQEG